MHSADYDQQTDAVLVSYENHHCIIGCNDNNVNVNVTNKYEGPSTSSMCLFCNGDTQNKYIAYSDAKQRLKIISSDFSHNEDYRFEETLHEFGHSTCRDTQSFDGKMIG